MPRASILVAEDDQMQARLIRVYLQREGYDVRVVHDGGIALERARATQPDLLVLDVMMPSISGLEVCRILRAEASTVPILLLTARSTEADLLLGLDTGADDYLTKPYSPLELAARVRALLRRAADSGSGEPSTYTVGDLVVDVDRFEVRVAGHEVPLTAKEFGILTVLAAEPGRVFTRAQIIDRAFGSDQEVLSRTVDTHVVNLRRKLGRYQEGRDCVQTVYGRGYRVAGREEE